MTNGIEPSRDVWDRRKQEAMAVLAGSMTKMPVRFWEEKMLFKGVPNTWWRLNAGGFPATNYLSGTHPLFVLRKNGNLNFQICPCSSQGGQFRYIKAGCSLLLTGQRLDRNCFLVEHFRFSLPVTATFSPQPEFRGKVPESCIADGRP